MPARAEHPVCEFHCCVTQVYNRVATLGFHPQPFAGRVGFKGTSCTGTRRPNLKTTEPVEEHCDGAKISMLAVLYRCVIRWFCSSMLQRNEVTTRDVVSVQIEQTPMWEKKMCFEDTQNEFDDFSTMNRE